MGIAKDLQQKRPLRSPEQEAYLGLVRTAAVLTDRLERLLKPAGLTGPQYNVLRILLGAEPKGLCRNEVRDRMLTRMPDMTRLLDRMEAAGLVSRAREESDRRLVRTRITDRGRKVLEELEGGVAAEHRDTFASLDEAEVRSLIGLLDRIRESA